MSTTKSKDIFTDFISIVKAMVNLKLVSMLKLFQTICSYLRNLSENVVMLYEFFMNQRITPEATFADVQDLKVTLRDTGNFTIQLNNLFKGNEELEKTTNMLFNQNWRPVYEIIRPAVEEAVESVMLDRSKKAFNYVPAKYLFRNFHWVKYIFQKIIYNSNIDILKNFVHLDTSFS